MKRPRWFDELMVEALTKTTAIEFRKTAPRGNIVSKTMASTLYLVLPVARCDAATGEDVLTHDLTPIDLGQ